MSRSRLLGLAVLLAAPSLDSSAGAQRVTVGERLPALHETPHPYAGGAEGLAFRVEIRFPGAAYIAPHFAVFDLAPGDSVVVRSPDGRQQRTYSGQGRRGLGRTPQGFFATHVKGDTAVVELQARPGSVGYGFTIDSYGRGYSDAEIRRFWALGLGERMNLPRPARAAEALCGADDTRNAKCYLPGEPQIYERSRAVARLLYAGSALCTGWLVGNAGHLLTNQHCITSQSDLDDVDFEFMAEGESCDSSCASTLACPGVVEASGGTLVQVDVPLDYALVIPDTSNGSGTDLPAIYGYLQLRPEGAELNERMYLPGHPAGWGKRIAAASTHPGDPGGLALVTSLDEPACSGGPPEVGYYADTQGGSSGSPVLGYADHKVIALHHCRGSVACTASGEDRNRGVAIQHVIADLGANVPPGSTCTSPDPPGGIVAAATGPNQVTLTWEAAAGAASYDVYRGRGSCPGSGRMRIAAGVTGTSYVDGAVSGGLAYAYTVTSLGSDGCASRAGVCSSVPATGICSEPPDFSGLASTGSATQASCTVDLSWDEAASWCGGSLRYNVYRSETSGFDPGSENRIARCLSGTSYSDLGARSGTTYHYVVRAEDDHSIGGGQCGGHEESNSVELSATAAGPPQYRVRDDMEAGSGRWVVYGSGGGANWSLVTTLSRSPSHSFFVPNPAVVSVRSLATASPLRPDGTAILEFWHRYEMEKSYDGGVLEYSADGGATWTDILAGDGASVPANAGRFLQGGYNSVISRYYDNPLGGRNAWSGLEAAFSLVRIDLSDFSGRSVLFRLRFGSDRIIGRQGWFVDDFAQTVGPCLASPALELDDAAVVEGHAGVRSMGFTVSLSAPQDEPVRASFETAGRTATPGADYVATTGSLVLPAGTTQLPVNVSVVGDTLIEPDETLALRLFGATGAFIAKDEGTGTILDDDAPALSGNELSHGAEQTRTLDPLPGPVARVDHFRLAQGERSSYEAVVDATSGDLGPGLLVERLGASNADVLQTAEPVGTGSAMSLRWQNRVPGTIESHHIRVRSGGCATDCGVDDSYRIRLYETSCGPVRFNNAGSQRTVLVLQNPSSSTIEGHVDFWDVEGSLIATQAFVLAAKASTPLQTAAVVPERSGSITVTHDGPYGGLVGKAASFESATGYSFDTPLASRPR